MQLWRAAAIVLGTSALAGRPSHAQQASVTPRTPAIGLEAGANLATLAGPDDAQVRSRTDWYAGMAMTFAIGPIAFVHPMLLYSRMGAAHDSAGLGEVARLEYLETVLTLGAYLLPPARPFRPFVLAGASIGILTLGGTGLRRVDKGVTVGAGVDFPLGPSDFTLDARFTWGLTEPYTGLRLRNRALSLGAGISVPFLSW